MSSAFYCASSELYFPGAVGLVNSLRLAGHDEPIYLLDCGLTPAHRELLAQAATIVDAPDEREPYLLKTVAPLAHPAETMVLIDVDMIVTRPLIEPLATAAEDRVVVVKDNIERWDPRWGELLGLGALTERPYVTSGLVILGGATGAGVARRWDELNHRVEYERSWFAAGEESYPFKYIDQDVLNAILASLDPGRVATLDPEAAPVPPFRRLDPDGPTGLACSWPDGRRPFVVHQFVRKPWIEPMYHSVYSELLARAWTDPAAPIRMPDDEIPLRMRHGALARMERRRVDLTDLARWYAFDVIPDRLRDLRRAP